MKLPTKLARQLLEHHVEARIEKTIDTTHAIASFQRLALAGAEFDVCLEALTVWFPIKNRKIAKDSPMMKSLEMIYNIVKQDVLGTAVDAIMAIMDASTGPIKDKLAAAAIVNELYGEKELIKDTNLTDKLMINLVGKDK